MFFLQITKQIVSSNTSKTFCGFFCFVFVLFSKIYQSGKNTIFLTLFLGISKENASEKFQRRTINPAELESLKNLMFLEKRPSFFQKQVHNFSLQKKKKKEQSTKTSESKLKNSFNKFSKHKTLDEGMFSIKNLLYLW